MKSLRQILGEQLTSYRIRARMRMKDILKKSGMPRQSIYDIQNGKNFTVDQYEKAIRACGVTPEDWFNGLPNPDSAIPRRHQDLLHMLEAIIASGDATMIEGVRTILDPLADKAIEKQSRESSQRDNRPPPGKQRHA